MDNAYPDFTSEPENEIRDVGTGKLKINKITHSYNRTLYDVTLIEGTMPDRKVICRRFGGYEDLFGARVQNYGNGEYRITVHGSD